MGWTLSIGSLTFGLFDFIALGIMLIGAVSCAVAGFSKSAAKSFGLILSFPIALLFSNALAKPIASSSGMSMVISTLIAFTSLSMIIYVLFNFLGNLLETTLDALHLSAVDSLLGFFWGILTTAIGISIAAALIRYQPFIDVTPLLRNSILFRKVFSDLYPDTIGVIQGAVNAIS